jgi:ABC-type phosphate transport system substrate-binding protein
MGRNTTRPVCHDWVAWTWLPIAVAACTGGADLDPRRIARELGTDRPYEARDDRPLPVVASIGAVQFAGMRTGTPAPAPAVESAREGIQRQTVRIVVGHDAAHVVDGRLLAQFAAGGQLALDSAQAIDREAVSQLLLGRCDFAVLGSALAPADLEAGLRQTKLGVELFGLAVAHKHPARSLTRAQVRSVLAGQSSNWSDVGSDGGHIVALVPADRALRERAALAMIPGDPFGRDCVPVHDGELGRQLQRPGAVAVVRIGERPLPQGVRLLHVDWNPPTAESFAKGFYPFGLPIVLATAGEPAGTAADFLAFARGGAGRPTLAAALLTGQ